MQNNKHLNRRKFLAGMAASSSFSLLALSGCATTPYGSKQSYISQVVKPQNQSTVLYWLDVAMQQTRDQRVLPPRAAYNYAMPLLAGFLAGNAITRDFEEPFGIGDGPRNANPEVAYGVAFSIAAAQVFQQPFLFERRRFLATFADSDAKTEGIEWGKKVARIIIKQRNDDGSEPSEVNYYFDNFKRRGDSLQWTPTGPFYSASPGPAFGSFGRGLFPSHGKIKPWTMTGTSQFRAKEFYHPRSPEFAAEFDMIRRLGGADSTIRTADESQIALFWEDGPWGISPAGHYLYIAMQLLQEGDVSSKTTDGFIQQARNFALLGMTQCDASISAWDNKYHYDIIRPESAIRARAAKFGNTDSRVVKQSDWRSFIPTPNFPAYTSGHSTFAGAAEMLVMILGSDKISFSGRSPDHVLWPQLIGVERHWTSITQMTVESSMSRLYGGVHWDIDHTEAMNAGRQIARQAFDTFFQPRV